MKGRVMNPDALTAGQLGEMLALLQGHFDGVGREQFAHDLAGKNRVLLLEDDGGRLRGFSTMHCHPATVGGERVQVVYSGDTIIDREAWGSPALARTWIGAVHELRDAGDPKLRWFWLLISSGFRTYRFLPVFWREFWPRRGVHMPARVRAAIDALARERFGEDYDPATGIVRFRHPQVLRGDMGEIGDARRRNPDVEFFLQRNPRHGSGDELVCFCELSDQNLTAAGRRIVDRLRHAHAPSRTLG